MRKKDFQRECDFIRETVREYRKDPYWTENNLLAWLMRYVGDTEADRKNGINRVWTGRQLNRLIHIIWEEL